MAIKIRKQTSGKWACIINLKGRQKTVVVGTKRAATMLRDELEVQIAKEKLGFLEKTPTEHIFSVVADEWLELHKDRVRIATLERYASAMRIYITPFFGKRDISGITRPEILAHLRGLYRGSIKGKGQKSEVVSASLINIIVAIISQIYQHAMENEIIDTTPMTGIGKALRLKKPRHDTEPFTADQIESLLAAAPDKFRLFFLFAFRSGCRIGELLGLHWDDIDLHKGTVKIQRSIDQSKRVGLTKNGKERIIALSPQLLAELIKCRDKSGVVFKDRKGDYLYSMRVRRQWIKMLKKTKMPYIKFHHIRHSVASLLIAGGADPKSVQHQLGHSNIGITMDLYTHYIAQDTAITGMLDNHQNTRHTKLRAI